MEHIKYLASAMVFSLFAYLTHGIDKITVGLVNAVTWFFITDTIIGLWYAALSHTMRSRRMRDGMSGKVLIFSALGSCGIGVHMISDSWWTFDLMMTCCMGYEGISILETVVAVRKLNLFSFGAGLDKAIDLLSAIFGGTPDSSRKGTVVRSLSIISDEVDGVPTVGTYVEETFVSPPHLILNQSADHKDELPPNGN